RERPHRRRYHLASTPDLLATRTSVQRLTGGRSAHAAPSSSDRRIPMAVEVEGLDVTQLRSEIQRTYADVSTKPGHEFIFPTGRAWALDLGYPQDLLARVPEASCESFAGVANPFSMGALRPGEDVLDVGCGACTDTLIAAQMVGPTGSVTGIDMTPEMVTK